MTVTENAPAAEEIEAASAWVGELRGALHEVIIGQDELLHGLLIGLLTGFVIMCYQKFGPGIVADLAWPYYALLASSSVLITGLLASRLFKDSTTDEHGPQEH